LTDDRDLDAILSFDPIDTAEKLLGKDARLYNDVTALGMVMAFGIYVCTNIASLDEKNYLKGEFEKSGMTVEELISHPKFMGYFENDRFRPFKMFSPRADRSSFRD
jgi:hypothetical protein